MGRQKSTCTPNFAKRPGRMMNGCCHAGPYRWFRSYNPQSWFPPPPGSRGSTGTVMQKGS